MPQCPANTTKWPIGALVIHDADAKAPHMLMRVTGYTPKGLCQTRYAFNHHKWPKFKQKTWTNDIAYLHDPARFNIEIPSAK